MIDPKRELFKWGPIDGRPCYIDPFSVAFEDFNKFYGKGWPDTICLLKDDKITFVIDYVELRKNGEYLFRKFILDEVQKSKIFDAWLGTSNKIRDFAEKDLSVTDKELAELFNEWSELQLKFWIDGFIPEVANWGGEQILKNEILKFNKLNFIEIFEKLSTPEDLSFFQKEELELMKIKLMPKEEQEKALQGHQKKYYWIRNNYAFTKVLDVNFFRKELENVSEDQAQQKIHEIEHYINNVKKTKKDIILKYNIDAKVVNIAEKLSFSIWWQDYRKSFIFIINHIITKFVEEAAKRKNLDFKEVCYYTVNELKELLENGKKVNAKARFNGFVEYTHEKGGITYMTGEEANNFIKPYITEEFDENMKEFSGIVVSKGKQPIVKGSAKIILSPDEADKLQEGDILIAPMTSPDFIVAMRKAAAIITDEGGMTCHAAIVSRELGIPCITAARIATKLLKDKDLIEVDADNGVVRRLM